MVPTKSDPLRGPGTGTGGDSSVLNGNQFLAPVNTINNSASAAAAARYFELFFAECMRGISVQVPEYGVSGDKWPHDPGEYQSS